MKLGIISDTHIPTKTARLPKKVFTVFKGVDYILHAGDIEIESVLAELSGIAPVEAVAGNMDGGLGFLPFKREWKLDNCTIGLIHGAGGPRNQIRERVRKEFIKPDLIVYGHTHEAFWGEEGGVYFINPGSPIQSILNPNPTVGLIHINEATFSGEIIRL